MVLVAAPATPIKVLIPIRIGIRGPILLEIRGVELIAMSKEAVASATDIVGKTYPKVHSCIQLVGRHC